MAKIDPNFKFDMYKFIHKPIRDADLREGRLFVERFLVGPQRVFEDTQAKINTLSRLIDPALTPQPRFLKDHVGFTNELSSITNDINDNDLRKLISLAVALWKQKGIEPGYANIVRLFTGKTARIFNWFDFRWIVGEKSFGEEQLGEDAWLISVPGVEASADQTAIRIVAFFPFEGNARDRSLTGNDGDEHGLGVNLFYFNHPPPGALSATSQKFARFLGGSITAPNSASYDLSGDWTVELFIRPSAGSGTQTLFQKIDGTGKGFKITLDLTANEITYLITDGINSITKTLVTGVDLDDGTTRHLALVADRANNRVRMYLNGLVSTSVETFGLTGDVTNKNILVLGGSAVGLDSYLGDMDNFRLAITAVYDTSQATLTPPLSGFIEFQEEFLDEFQIDIRIVDELDPDNPLDKILILRILNLMRPVSERINVIFIRFFDDFFDGIGQFDVLSGSAAVNTSQQMQIEENSFLTTSVLGDAEFRDIILQTKANNLVSDTTGIFSILFFVQDDQNYYEFRIDMGEREVFLFRVIGGSETDIGAGFVSEDIVTGASYIFTVSTSFNTTASETKIKCFVDSNVQFDVIDNTYNQGKFGYKTSSLTTMQIDEIEMLQLPVDVQRINPNFDL